jgi:hypothetical protein
MWLWVVVTLAGILFLVVLLLCVPLYFIVTIDSQSDVKFRARFIWLFGIIRRDIKKRKLQKEGVTSRQTGKKHRKLHPETIFKLIKIKGIVNRISRLVMGIFRSIKIKSLTANLNVGLEDPADTASLFVLTGPVNALLHLLPYQITVWPTYNGDLTFNAYVYSTVRLYPVLLIPPLLCFIFSAPVFNIARVMVTAKRK